MLSTAELHQSVVLGAAECRPLRYKFMLAVVLVMLCAWTAGAQQTSGTHTVSTVATRTDAPITLDGRLDEPAWQAAAKADGFVQSEPEEGKPATERTEVRVLYDDRNLYVGVMCFDSLAAGVMVNSLKEDFAPSDADYFEVILDSLHNQRGGFLFTTNPMGAKRDSQITDEGRTTNTDWDTVWDVRARRTAEGWVAEFVIPFKSLAFNEGASNETWGINFSRSIRRKNEQDVWSPVPRRATPQSKDPRT